MDQRIADMVRVGSVIAELEARRAALAGEIAQVDEDLASQRDELVRLADVMAGRAMPRRAITPPAEHMPRVEPPRVEPPSPQPLPPQRPAPSRPAAQPEKRSWKEFVPPKEVADLATRRAAVVERVVAPMRGRVESARPTDQSPRPGLWPSTT